MKKRVIISLLLILTLSLATFAMAENEEETFSVQDAYDWLASESNEGSYGDDVFTTAWAVLALDAVGYTANAESSVAWILEQKSDSATCFPAADCETQDTALALMAFDAINEDSYVDEIESWLMDSQSDATVSGDWLIEVSTSDNETCIFSYELNNVTNELEFEVDAGEFPACGDSTFFNLKDCLTSNLISNNPSLILSVDCSALSGDVVLTHLYKSSNSYYIIESVYGTVHDFLINNGCFGRGAGDTCHKEASFYANWALATINSDYNTLIYLKENVDESSVQDNAFLYMLTADDYYANNLIERQRSDGSFERDIQDTALAILALKYSGYSSEIDAATEWLKEQQEEDGSWNSDILTTSLVLYAAFDTASVSAGSCYDGIQNQDERGIDCGGVCNDLDNCCFNGVQDEGEEDIDSSDYCSGEGNLLICDNDGICDELQGEDADNCPSDCEVEASCYNNIQDGDEEGVDCGGSCLSDCCIVDGYCDVDNGEDASNCLADCNNYCGDGYCQSGEDCAKDGCYLETEAEEEPQEEQKEEGSLAWLWILLIIILIGLFGAAGYVAYKQGYFDSLLSKLSGGSKKPKAKGTKSAYTPYSSKLSAMKKPATKPKYSAPVRLMGKSRLDKELDKSISEAKKLLGKK